MGLPLAACTHSTSRRKILFPRIYSCRQAFWSAHNVLSHARGQGGRGNLGEEGRGEARLQAAAAAAAAGCTPHSRPASPFTDSLLLLKECLMSTPYMRT